jgi:phosphatidyl-myo-inositol alpha-mannosyltransferase
MKTQYVFSAGSAPVTAAPRAWNIAIVHPTFWPYVRRGTERFMAEWSERLAQAGHKVTILTSKPGQREVVCRNGVRIDYRRSLWTAAMTRAGVLDFHVFPLTTFVPVLAGRFDLIHTFNFTDTLAAAALRPFTRVPVLLHLNTIPPPVQYRRSLSTGGRLLRAAIDTADELLVISRQQQEYFESRFGRTCLRLAAPVDTDQFAPARHIARRSSPLLLCASALDDRRKGGRILMRAFGEIKRHRPDVRLEICYALPRPVVEELLALVEPRWRADIEFTHATSSEDLAAAYARATALVLPSLWEAFPLVVLEALAAGTPVAGTADGGIPEILESGGAGITFDPGPPLDGGPSNLDGLVAALLEVLGLSQQSETASRCRAAAERFSWNRMMPAYTELYAKLIGCR